jgi:2,3-bisphosphoglycerate-independent phosphoglycerate mutase
MKSSAIEEPDAELRETPRQPGPREAAAARQMREHRARCGYDKVALRCAYADASHLLDAIREDRRPARPLRGEAARIAEAVDRALKDAADAIWALRDG